MRQLGKQILNLLLYGNFWIALCGLLMCLQTEYLIQSFTTITPVSIFVFGGTLFIYAMHRAVGLKKVAPFQNKGRYQIIATFRHHIIIYAIVGLIISAISFWYLSLSSQLLLLLPSLVALGYVVPFLKNGKRLRDIDHVKIYLVALVWGILTVLLPAAEHQVLRDWSIWFVLIERCCFIFAITLPFDIRDLLIDEHTKVQTIPARIGINSTLILAMFLLLIMSVTILVNYLNGFYSISTVIALMISMLSTALLIYGTKYITDDYYFTGLLDGTMIIQSILVIGLF